MPKALDPNNTFDVWLDSDTDKPPAERPTFTFRYITGREAMVIVNLRDGIEDHETGADVLAKMFEALWKPLKSWRHMGDFKFEANSLPDLLTMAEAAELFEKMTRGMQPDATTLGKSD